MLSVLTIMFGLEAIATVPPDAPSNNPPDYSVLGAACEPAVPPLVKPLPPDPAPIPEMRLPEAPKPSRWSLSFETSNLFATVNNPFIFLIKTKWEGPNPLHYKLATQVVGVRYAITQPSGWRFLRGNWETSFGILYSAILHGPETYILGGVTGLRYNFVPKESRLSPYIEFRFGVNNTDASHVFQGQQQDLTFTYLLGGGVRYDIDSHWRVSVGALTQHESDFFMTDPNYGFNVLGVSLGVERRF